MKKLSINEFVKNNFNSRNIRNTEDLFLFAERKKIIVFVPVEYIDLVSSRMSNAGAGIIGNYRNCSFMTKGIGTFIPVKKANPHSGEKNKLSFEEEIKLEMECSIEDLNNVIDEMLKYHPYEETAYEIYDFKVRENKKSGLVLNFKKDEKLQTLLKKITPEINIKLLADSGDHTFRRLAITGKAESDKLHYSVKFLKCDFLITISKNIKILKNKLI
jgi:hypothetical protein